MLVPFNNFPRGKVLYPLAGDHPRMGLFETAFARQPETSVAHIRSFHRSDSTHTTAVGAKTTARNGETGIAGEHVA